MDAGVKKYLMTLLYTGHCKTMSGALACNYCGDKFKKGEAEYNRLRREKPELFGIKESEFLPSQKLNDMRDQIAYRVKHDKLYREHLRKSQYGTIEEQNREADKANRGFYKKHSNYKKKIL